jgi:succinate dehydrogenase flavin-adding protein (antitoxin of CptAB toxin-antitoxin module)
MKELDLLLLRHLRQAWPAASPDERARFEALLELPDPELAGYLLGHELAPPELRTLIERLRQP